jgi:predicted Kef-type K+ transport protein
MIAAYLALVAGIIVAIAYLIVIFRGFHKSKAEMAAHGGAQLGEVQLVGDNVFDEQEVGILWKAAAGLILSGAVLWLVTLSPVVWYAVPFLGLGTSLAVIAAFQLDRDPAPALDR